MKNQTTIAFIIGLLSLIISGGIFAYVFHSTYMTIESTAELIAEAQNATKQSAGVREINKEIITSKKEREFLQGLFVDIEDISSLLQFLENLAEKNNIELEISTITKRTHTSSGKSKKSKSKNKKQKISDVIVQVGVVGARKDILRFVNALPESKKASYVEQMHITKEDGAQWNGRVKIIFLTLNQN